MFAAAAIEAAGHPAKYGCQLAVNKVACSDSPTMLSPYRLLRALLAFSIIWVKTRPSWRNLHAVHQAASFGRPGPHVLQMSKLTCLGISPWIRKPPDAGIIGTTGGPQRCWTLYVFLCLRASIHVTSLIWACRSLHAGETHLEFCGAENSRPLTLHFCHNIWARCNPHAK